MAIGSIWKADDKFVIQFNNVKPREKPIIFNSLNGWSQSGSGFQKDGTEIFIFSNKTEDESKVFQIVKSFPFPFTEEKKNGESKKIRTQHNDKTKAQPLTRSPLRAKIGGGRTCSRCNQKGHNSRTCKNDLSQ
jgi:hypothetical protein